MQTPLLQIPIDRAGRVVLPKTLRERLGFQVGTEFEVIEQEGGIFLKPIVKTPKLATKGSLLVVTPEVSPTVEAARAVTQRNRAERNQKLGGSL